MHGNTRVLITGGTGSWGHELVSQIIDDPEVEQIVIYSRGEHKQVHMKLRFTNHLQKLRFLIGDVRDIERLKVALKGVHKVYHMAALKHVPVCEENPWEAVQTNIVGTNNVIEAAIHNDVRRVVFISTDKAVDPLSLYGVTKSCAEKLIINANQLTTQTAFVCLRAGNVLGTNGSVVPLFIEQIKRSNAITITHPEMSRFFLRVEDAIRLVLRAERDAIGGEITVVKMPACRITDLAEVMIEELGDASTEIHRIGIRPGEKIHEVLVSRYEAARVIQRGEWFVILPMIHVRKIDEAYAQTIRVPLLQEYSSQNADQLTKDGIRKLLQLGGFFDQKYSSTLTGLGPDELLNLFKREGWVRDDDARAHPAAAP
jgi:FlaA1/EpsC-like NDP-sugar epimerase